jgi:hypothetical protein
MDNNQTLTARKATLERISGLAVTIRQDKNQRVFVFANGSQTVKEAWTYPKAKMFAEGIRLGRTL